MTIEYYVMRYKDNVQKVIEICITSEQAWRQKAILAKQNPDNRYYVFYSGDAIQRYKKGKLK